MKIVLLSEQSMRVDASPGAMSIEAVDAEQSFSPFHMLGGSLAYCSLSAMYLWATNAGMKADDLAIEVDWTFADDPHRVDGMHMSFQWPSLPPARLEAAKRVAELCAIHATLQHPPRITIDGTTTPVNMAAAAGTSDARR